MSTLPSRMRLPLIAAALAMSATVPMGSGPMEGTKMTDEDRERRKEARTLRAPQAMAKAEAKRQRKAAKRASLVSRAAPDTREEPNG